MEKQFFRSKIIRKEKRRNKETVPIKNDSNSSEWLVKSVSYDIVILFNENQKEMTINLKEMRETLKYFIDKFPIHFKYLEESDIEMLRDISLISLLSVRNEDFLKVRNESFRKVFSRYAKYRSLYSNNTVGSNLIEGKQFLPEGVKISDDYVYISHSNENIECVKEGRTNKIILYMKKTIDKGIVRKLIEILLEQNNKCDKIDIFFFEDGGCGTSSFIIDENMKILFNNYSKKINTDNRSEVFKGIKTTMFSVACGLIIIIIILYAFFKDLKLNKSSI